eukprot:3861836-Pyramimonas_sp.AAC.1
MDYASFWICARKAKVSRAAQEAGAYLDQIDREFLDAQVSDCKIKWVEAGHEGSPISKAHHVVGKVVGWVRI